MSLMGAMTTSLAHRGSEASNVSSVSSSTTTSSITPPLVTRGVSYNSVTSIPNLLNYDGQPGSGIREAKTSHNNDGTAKSPGSYLPSSSWSSQNLELNNYRFGNHQRVGSLDFLADTAIDQDMNQEEFKRIVSRLSQYNTRLAASTQGWRSKNIKEVQMEEVTQLSLETRSLSKYTDRLLELKSITDWDSKKPQLPSINQLRNELQKSMVEFQFPAKPAFKNIFNVTVKNTEVQVPSSTVSSNMDIPSFDLQQHRVSRSDGSIIPGNNSYKVDKAKPKKKASISHQRKISVAAGDGTEACKHCGETVTPEWRRGPYGNRTLCNACGLFYCKLIRKFNVKDANTLMHYRKIKGPEDRRVPDRLTVPLPFIKELEDNNELDEVFNVKTKREPVGT